jgi:hypothetical protein
MCKFRSVVFALIFIIPRNAFCIEQKAAAKSKEAQVRVFGLSFIFHNEICKKKFL